MGAQKGPALAVLVGDGEAVETFTRLAGIQSKTLRMGTERLETTTDDDISLDGVSFRTHIPGISNFEIQGSGIAKGDANIQRVIEDGRTGTIRNYRVEWPKVGVFRRSMFLSDFEVTAAYDGVIEFSTTLLGDQPIDYDPVTEAPVNTVLPSIAGIAQVGATLTALRGLWTQIPAFAYRWQRDDGGWEDSAGATAQTYTPVAADEGNALRVVVTATNAIGATTAQSAPTAATLAD